MFGDEDSKVYIGIMHQLYMAKIKCGDCGRSFNGTYGKEDTCPRCLGKIMHPEMSMKQIEAKINKMAGY